MTHIYWFYYLHVSGLTWKYATCFIGIIGHDTNFFGEISLIYDKLGINKKNRIDWDSARSKFYRRPFDATLRGFDELHS